MTVLSDLLSPNKGELTLSADEHGDGDGTVTVTGKLDVADRLVIRGSDLDISGGSPPQSLGNQCWCEAALQQPENLAAVRFEVDCRGPIFLFSHCSAEGKITRWNDRLESCAGSVWR